MKIRISALTFFLCLSWVAIAQRVIPPTDSLRIVGQVKNPTTFVMADLDKLPKTPIKDQIIYNHNGEVKDTLTGMAGVSLKTLLSPVQYVYDKPKVLNEFYFVFVASDGYKVVFSWNEIYNTEVGNDFFIVTQLKGKQAREMDQRIMFISAADLKSGRRYIKGLERIEVRRVE